MHRFSVPAGAREVGVASRTTVPAEINAATSDRRCLGVPVSRVVLRNGTLSIEALHRDEGLRGGFHEAEKTLRWTDGNAQLPEPWLRAFSGGFTLEIHLAPSELPYRSATARAPVETAAAVAEERLPAMTGARPGVLGEGGALPAGRHVHSEAGLRYAVVGQGADRGIPYVDVRISGTPAASSNANQLFFADWREVAAAAGEEWTIAAYVALLAGSLANVRAIEIGASLNRADGEYSSWFGATGLLPRVEPLGTRRFGLTHRIADRNGAYLMPLLQIAVIEGRPVDMVLRIGQPHAAPVANFRAAG